MAHMQRYLGPLLIIMPFVFLIGSQQPSARDDKKNMASQKVEDVSLIQLIADAKTYHHRRVRVVGYYHQGYEESALYLHSEDYRHMITKNAVWIDSIEPTPRTTTDRYLLWEGVFNADSHGHLGQYSGALEEASPPIAWK